MTCHLINSGRCDAAFNMALDEAMLDASLQLGAPILRFYGWTQPAATFGYFQHYAEIERLTPLRPLIRRPTGGGLVPHDADWTYSFASPAGSEWHSLRAEESYRRIHEWICRAFASIGIEAALAPCCKKTLPGQCFVGHEKFDLLWRGKKIAGAAQRRNKSGLLIQGSIQPPLASLNRAEFEAAMLKTAGPAVRWSELPAENGIFNQAEKLASEKFSRDEHNRRR